MSRGSPRRKAAGILAGILDGKGSLATALDGSDGPDAALIQELCYGVCRHYHELEHLANSLLNRPLKKKDRDIFCLILVGLYQLLYMRVPDHAAVHETVESVPRPWARGLVNAVLRRARRMAPETLSAPADDPVLRFSHPRWLVDRLREDWPEEWQDILAANNARAPMSLRVNLLRTSRDDYLQALEAAGIAARPGAFCGTSVVPDRPLPVADLPGFAEGRVSVQDEASQLVPGVMALAAGQRVLDACAAPGGKTCAMLEAEPGLRMWALDPDPARLERVRDNLAREALEATVSQADANDVAQWWDGESFDRILLDAPCSATGVIRRHPDIKLLRRPEDIADLQARQDRLLVSLWGLLKPGGLLLYTTCSVLLDENSRQIEHFCSRHAGARPLDFEADWGLACRFGRQLLPGVGNCDGFYYALLQKY